MVKMEAILKTWYDALKEDGKITGLKCRSCGAIEFPPVPVCNTCSGMDMEWVEVDGEGELISLSYSPMGVAPYSTAPAVTGYCRLKDGMLFEAILLDIDEEKQSELIERMKEGDRIFVKLEISNLDENYSFPCFRILD